MPRRGRRRKKTRTHAVETDDRIRGSLISNDESKIPRSLVVRRGKVEPELADLVSDLRRLMRPHTAVNFKEDARDRKATLARYAASLSGPLGVTHVVALSQNGPKITLRIGRTPAGPTLSFRVKRFTLGGSIRAAQRRPYDSIKAYESPPVVVTNNFGDATAAPHVKLMRITFQNMFPAIDVGKVKLSECRRVVLFNFVRRDKAKNAAGEGGAGDADAAGDNAGDDDGDLEDEEVEVRHYAIRAKPVGVDRKVRRIVEAKIPNLSRLNDIAEYITGDAPGVLKPGDVSDSEPEDETSHVVLPTAARKKRGGKEGGPSTTQKSALKLVELGPRLRLKLYKVERGMASGDVMYHAYVSKTPEEARALKARKEGEAALKKRRREEQEQNVARKRAAKEEKRTAREERRKIREERAMAALRGEAVAESEGEEETSDESSDTGSEDVQDDAIGGEEGEGSNNSEERDDDEEEEESGSEEEE